MLANWNAVLPSATRASHVFPVRIIGRYSNATSTATLKYSGCSTVYRDSARRVREDLLADDWARLAVSMQQAYPNRKRLARNYYPQMDQLVEKALANGAQAAKVCGAGGGGCIGSFVLPESEQTLSALC